jgi:hypothetical protein
VSTVTETSRYGKAFADAWDRAHQQLQRRAGWADHEGQLPTVEGTLIRLIVDRLPGDRRPKPVWLWTSATGLDPSDVDRLWHTFAASTWSTPSGCSNRPSAGPNPASATPAPPTAGRG